MNKLVTTFNVKYATNIQFINIMILYAKILCVKLIDNGKINQNRHITQNILINHVKYVLIIYDIQISMRNMMENVNYATNVKCHIALEEIVQIM